MSVNTVHVKTSKNSDDYKINHERSVDNLILEKQMDSYVVKETVVSETQYFIETTIAFEFVTSECSISDIRKKMGITV